jgi:hypothetical protein
LGGRRSEGAVEGSVIGKVWVVGMAEGSVMERVEVGGGRLLLGSVLAWFALLDLRPIAEGKGGQG